MIERSVALANAFRARKLPVVLVNVAGAASGRTDRQRMARGPLPPDWAQLVPELDTRPDESLVTKYTQGAFHGTPLDLMLRRRGATQIVLTASPPPAASNPPPARRTSTATTSRSRSTR